jgi:hypothetical protein
MYSHFKACEAAGGCIGFAPVPGVFHGIEYEWGPDLVEVKDDYFYCYPESSGSRIH